MIKNVYFNDVKTYDDLGLVFITRSTALPEIKEQTVDIPLRDGVIDYSEVATGKVQFNQREVDMSFFVFDDYRKWQRIQSNIASELHGQTKRITFDDELDRFYEGRVTLASDIRYKQRGVGTLEVKAKCKPFKYAVTTTAEPWIWDSFNFETGIIQELYNLEVNGTLDVKLYADRYSYDALIVTTNSAMTMTFGENTYSLTSGDNEMLDISLTEGENVFSFSGNGTVTINYRGGIL